MSQPLSLPPSLSADPNALNALRQQTSKDPKAALQAVARQFEAVFMRQLIKSMRDASPTAEASDDAGLGRDLLDDQLATQLAGRPGGLGEMLALQLSRSTGQPASAGTATAGSANSGTASTLAATPTTPATSAPTIAPVAPEAAAPLSTSEKIGTYQSRFVQQHHVSAQQVQAQTGLPAMYLLAQAGHESGWGRREIRQPDGSSTHNLFGIKAGPGWSGKVAEVTTTEYSNGKATTQVARFRAYDSYADAFKDYAQLITSSPRYAKVLHHTQDPKAFAQSLQNAGYATDPDYAQKLTRAINNALRWQRIRA